MSGTKNDAGKAPIHFITREFMEGLAKAQGFGAQKYGDYNFTKGIAYTRLLDAAMRHLVAFIWGEDNDKESGESHISHAAANLNMLMFMMKNHPELDDRYKKEDLTDIRKLTEVDKIRQDNSYGYDSSEFIRIKMPKQKEESKGLDKSRFLDFSKDTGIKDNK